MWEEGHSRELGISSHQDPHKGGPGCPRNVPHSPRQPHELTPWERGTCMEPQLKPQLLASAGSGATMAYRSGSYPSTFGPGSAPQLRQGHPSRTLTCGLGASC